MTDKEIIADLLIDFNNLKPDLQKFDGNPAPALAERLIVIINKMTPFADLFDDNFKAKIKEYIETYSAALKGEKKGQQIFQLIHPVQQLIDSTLKSKYEELNG